MAYEQCCYCHGTGKKTCSRCNGSGEVYGNVQFNRKFTCSECDGTGETDCPMCNGLGYVDKEE